MTAVTQQLVDALVVAREFISIDRNTFAECNIGHDGSYDPDAQAELADYDQALLQIDAAIAAGRLIDGTKHNGFPS